MLQMDGWMDRNHIWTQMRRDLKLQNVKFLANGVFFLPSSSLLETIATRYGPQLTGKLPDREEDWTRPVQRGVPGEVPARQHLGGLEESPGNQEIKRRLLISHIARLLVQILLKLVKCLLWCQHHMLWLARSIIAFSISEAGKVASDAAHVAPAALDCCCCV